MSISLKYKQTLSKGTVYPKWHLRWKSDEGPEDIYVYPRALDGDKDAAERVAKRLQEEVATRGVASTKAADLSAMRDHYIAMELGTRPSAEAAAAKDGSGASALGAEAEVGASPRKRLRRKSRPPPPASSAAPPALPLEDGTRTITLHRLFETELPGLLSALGNVEGRQADLEQLWDRLQVLRGPGGRPQHIAPGGATHLRADTITPWHQECGFKWWLDLEAGIQDRAAVCTRLRAYIWWLDLLACSDDRDQRVEFAHGGSVDHAACPRCRGLWSGVLAAPRPAEEGDDDEGVSPGFRFPLNVHVREPGLGLWQHQDPDFWRSSHGYELRLFCISRDSLQVLLHADTRRALGAAAARLFASVRDATKERNGRYKYAARDCALTLSVWGTEDADGDGCVFDCLDLETAPEGSGFYIWQWPLPPEGVVAAIGQEGAVAAIGQEDAVAATGQ